MLEGMLMFGYFILAGFFVILGLQIRKLSKEKENETLRADNAEKHLAIIGDLAVVDWDGPTVGKVDAVVDPRKYHDYLRDVLSRSTRCLKAEAEREQALISVENLKGQLKRLDEEFEQVSSNLYTEKEYSADATERLKEAHSMLADVEKENSDLRKLVPNLQTDNVCAACEYHGKHALEYKQTLIKTEADRHEWAVKWADTYTELQKVSGERNALVIELAEVTDKNTALAVRVKELEEQMGK